MAGQSIKDTIEGAGISLGKGTCGIFNKIRQASDDYKDYYKNKTNKGVADYVFNAANMIGRGSIKAIKGLGGVAKELWDSEDAKSARSGIADAYNALRDKYRDYLTASTERLNESYEKGEHHGFKSFVNGALRMIENVYSKGEDIARSAAKSVSNVKNSIKDSDAYKELAKANREIEDHDREHDHDKDDKDDGKAGPIYG